MSQVLGFVVQTLIKTYQSICMENNLDIAVNWNGPEKISLFKRYDWDNFAVFTASITRHLARHGVDPLTLQRKMSPSLFQGLYAARFAKRAFNPKIILKLIDTKAGPFLFRCGDSSFTELEENRVCVSINLHDGLKSCPEFFDHCIGGMVAQLEFFGFTSSRVERVDIQERSMCVYFLLEAGVDAKAPPRERQDKNILAWFEDFEINILCETDDDDQKVFSEAIDHLLSLFREYCIEHGALVDGLTVVSSRIQIARARGWASEEGLRNRKLAKEQAQKIRLMLVNRGALLRSES